MCSFFLGHDSNPPSKDRKVDSEAQAQGRPRDSAEQTGKEDSVAEESSGSEMGEVEEEEKKAATG